MSYKNTLITKNLNIFATKRLYTNRTLNNFIYISQPNVKTNHNENHQNNLIIPIFD